MVSGLELRSGRMPSDGLMAQSDIKHHPLCCSTGKTPNQQVNPRVQKDSSLPNF